MIIIAIMVVFVDVFNNAISKETLSQIISSVTLTILAILIFGQIKMNHLIDSIRSNQDFSGINKFYSNRAEMPSFDEWLDKSKEEVIIMGIQLGAITHIFLPKLLKCAERGVKVKLLLMSPISREGDKLPWVDEVGKLHTFKNLEEALIHNLQHINNWYEEIKATKIKSNIEIRCYDTIPTFSAVIIDYKTSNGFIKTEPIFYNFPPSDRPSFITTKYNSNQLYNHLTNSCLTLWDSSIGITTIINKIKGL